MDGATDNTLTLRTLTAGAGGVRLRDVVVADLPTFYAHQCDPAAVQMAAFASRNEKDFADHWSEILGNPEVLKRTIVHQGKVAGNLVSFEQSGKTLVGYWLGREHWGKGVATSALTQFLRVVTRRPIYAFVAKRNAGSLRVLQKCGFAIVSEGIGAPDANGDAVEELALVLVKPAARRTVFAYEAVIGSLRSVAAD
jgi:RimJ/RimL family protein N-acetyltransferase